MSPIDSSAWGTCQWAFCKAGGVVEIAATKYDRVGHRTVTHLFNACDDHLDQVTTELRRDYPRTKTTVR